MDAYKTMKPEGGPVLAFHNWYIFYVSKKTTCTVCIKNVLSIEQLLSLDKRLNVIKFPAISSCMVDRSNQCMCYVRGKPQLCPLTTNLSPGGVDIST